MLVVFVWLLCQGRHAPQGFPRLPKGLFRMIDYWGLWRQFWWGHQRLLICDSKADCLILVCDLNLYISCGDLWSAVKFVFWIKVECSARISFFPLFLFFFFCESWTNIRTFVREATYRGSLYWNGIMEEGGSTTTNIMLLPFYLRWKKEGDSFSLSVTHSFPSWIARRVFHRIFVPEKSGSRCFKNPVISKSRNNRLGRIQWPIKERVNLSF